MKTQIKVFFLSLIFCTNSVMASNLPQNFSFDGYLLDNLGNPIVSSTDVTIRIYNPAVNCLLYEELHTSVTPDATTGYFSLKVGTGTLTGNNPGLSFKTIFQNSSQVRATATPNCSPGYTPTTGDDRKLQIQVASEILTPNFSISPAPMATVAETLQGKVPSDFVSTTGSSNIAGNLTIKTGNALRLEESAGAEYLELRAPTLTNNYTLTFPADDGNSGNVLTTDGAGGLSWAAPGGGGITSLGGLSDPSQSFAIGTSGTSPAWSPAGSTHTLNLPQASSAGVTAGLISNADFVAFTNKLHSTLNSGQIFVGNGSNVATPVIPSGDVTLTNAGVFTVTKLQNQSVSSTSPSNGQVLKWNGSNWAPATLSSDFLSLTGGTLTGPVVMTTSGTAGTPILSIGGTGTGFFSPSANSLAISTNGTERMRITNTGNIGIGIPTPSAKLQVVGGLAVGSSSNPIQTIRYFTNVPCLIDNLTGIQSCTVNTISFADIGDSVICTPLNMPVDWEVITSCRVTALNTVKISVQKPAAQSAWSTPEWSITVIKF